MLAGAEINAPGALGNVHQRAEAAALVGAAAERLRGRAAAAAPVVGLARLDVHRDRAATGYGRLPHESSLRAATFPLRTPPMLAVLARPRQRLLCRCASRNHSCLSVARETPVNRSAVSASPS